MIISERSFFNFNSLFFIVGPCVIENLDLTLAIAYKLRDLSEYLEVPIIFKASFDKANRSDINSYRGPGLLEGLRILVEVKAKTSLLILSDIHFPSQAIYAADVLDIMQIPAFLCRQTDLLLAVGRTGKPVNIKKGQFISPVDIIQVIAKIRSTGNNNILITERGTSFGYNNLVVDMRSIPIMRKLGYPVIFDASHSVQLPGKLGNVSGGDYHFIAPLAKAAVAAGADGVFLEVHPCPSKALCDSNSSLPLDNLEKLLRILKEIYVIVVDKEKVGD